MPNSKIIYTRIKNRYDTLSNFNEVDYAPLKGEIIIYDVDGNLQHRKMKIGDGETKIGQLPFANDTEHTVVLEEDLYAYTPVGQISSASNTNPVKVASAGDTLKTVLNTVFGTQQDQQPTITTSNVKLNVDAGTTSYGGGEFGTAVASTDVTITFTLANSGTAQYGYRCGDTKTTTSNATFYYPVTKQNNADIKITLPFTISKVEDTTVDSVAYKKLTTVNGANKTITILTPSATYESYSTKYLYCNFNSSKQVSIKLNLPSGSVTTSPQTRYEQISASVTLGAAQEADGTAITNFLTYLKADPDASTPLGAAAIAALSCDPITNTAGVYTIKKGSKYVYWAKTSTTDTPTSWILYDPNQDGIGQTSVVDLAIPGEAGKYIWIASASEYNYLRLFNEVNGQYNKEDAACYKAIQTAEITNSQDVTADGYYFYATGPRNATNTVKLKLSNSLTD